MRLWPSDARRDPWRADTAAQRAGKGAGAGDGTAEAGSGGGAGAGGAGADGSAEVGAELGAEAAAAGGAGSRRHSRAERMTEAVRREVGRHRHGDAIHAHLDPHPHEKGDEGAPTVGIVGAGAVGTALGVAISRSGWPVKAVAGRSAQSLARFASLVPTARPFPDPVAVVDEVELIVLAVPDDAIASVVEPLRLYGGQAMVHTSGLLGAEVLAPALAAGSHVGAFHPLASFTADVDRSVAGLRGATVAIEGDDRLVGLLADLAEAIGGVPVRLPAGSKPAYHAAAVLASGGLVALLDAVAELAATAGIDEPGALAIYGRLLDQTLANARAGGLANALTGPIVRADVGTLEAHLAALEQVAPSLVPLYLDLARRELAIAERRGALTPEQSEHVATALAKVR